MLMLVVVVFSCLLVRLFGGGVVCLSVLFVFYRLPGSILILFKHFFQWRTFYSKVNILCMFTIRRNEHDETELLTI